MAFILRLTLLDRMTMFWLLPLSLLKRRAQSRTRSSVFGESMSVRLLGEKMPVKLLGEKSASIELKAPAAVASLSSLLRCVSVGVAGGVGATGNISDELCTWIHQLSFSMQSSIHWIMEVAFDNLLNMPSRCFMHSSSLITGKAINTGFQGMRIAHQALVVKSVQLIITTSWKAH